MSVRLGSLHDSRLDRSLKRGKRVAFVAVGLGVFWVGAACVLDRIGAGDLRSGHYDAIVVAGAGVLASGEPSRPLAARVDLAVDLHRRGYAPSLVMTGGVGSHPPAEAEVARARARARGVAASAIRIETRSTSTEENAAFAASILGRRARILLVTDRFHVFRARRVFRRHFDSVDAVGCVSSPWPRFRGAMREVVAVVGYAALGRL